MENNNRPPRKDPATIRLSQPLNPVKSNRTDTRPLSIEPELSRRPDGAIFGDAFASLSLVFNDERQNHYLVSQLNVPEHLRILECPNPSCGAFFPPKAAEPEKFCTDCGTVLNPGGQDMLLIETLSAIPENVEKVVELGLSHGSVRAPIAVFKEQLAGSTRHCLVMPHVSALEEKPEAIQILGWGVDLARGLEYLHDNGVSFAGTMQPNFLGLVDHRATWANFAGSTFQPDGIVNQRSDDVRALAMLIYYLLSGKQKFERDPNLPSGVNQVLEMAFSEQGFTRGSALAEALEESLLEVSKPQAVDFQVGRRTNVGMVRTLNEDSIMTVEINRVQRSISQPLGVYVVADGMGGHTAGEVASAAIVNAIAEKAVSELLLSQVTMQPNLDHGKWLQLAVEAANRSVLDLRKSGGTDMGSTLVSAVLDANKAYIAHVGDSRAYLINEQGIQQLTKDHSLVERLIATKQITREEARYHPQRNVIYRTVGDKSQVDVDISTHTLSIGDHLLLCSDGLSGLVEDPAIFRIILEAPSPQAACDALIEAANGAGGDDNISAIIIKIIPA